MALVFTTPDGKIRRSIQLAVSRPIVYYIAALALYYVHAHGLITQPEIYASLIGGGVGLIEILARYRSSPVRAAFTSWGFVYVGVNMLAAFIAYRMLGAYQLIDASKDTAVWSRVFAAGTGSLVVMRASVFKFRVGESDIGVGPAAILDSLLLVADRGVDRREGVARASDVSALVAQVKGKDPCAVARMLATYSLALMQNVDDDTSKTVGAAVSKIMSDPGIPDAIKLDIVALSLGVVVGQDVMDAAVSALADRSPVANAPATAPAPASPGAASAPPPAGPSPPTVQDVAESIDRARAQKP